MRTRTNPATDGAAYAKRLRKGNYQAAAVSVVAVTAFALLLGSGWTWGYFFWGLGAGLFAVACTRGAMRLMYLVISPEEVTLSRQRVRERYRSVYVTTLMTGAVVGALAASTQSAWPDILFMIFAVISVLPGLVMVRRLKRRTADASSEVERNDM